MNDLRTAAQQMLKACEQRLPLKGQAAIIDELNNLRAALAQQAEPVEPVAWYSEARHIDSAWAAAVTLKHPGPEGKYMRKVTPLYTAPPQRPPLTEEELKRIFVPDNNIRGWARFQHIARAIERAHGIGGSDE